MDRQEFNQWIGRYNDAFPDTLKWCNALRNPQATLETWWLVMKPLNIADANEVLLRLITGVLPAITGYEIQDTPRVIASMCRRLADENRKREYVASESRRRKDYEPLIDVVDDSFRDYWQTALRLGEAVKAGQITMQENNERMSAATAEWERSLR